METASSSDCCPHKKMKLNHDVENECELRQFHVLDELAEEASESEEEEGSRSGDDGDESQSEFEEEDIEHMLDAGLPEALRLKKKQSQYEERSKIVLEEKGRNHFEVLPEGWVQVTHNSGIPLYLHKSSRVCCVSRPYFLGPGSVRKHEIPLSSIPCLNYRKALEKEEEAARDPPAADTIEVTKPVNGHELLPIPNAKIETVKENLKAQSLTAAQMTEYCKRLFRFKTIKVRRFKSWSARRKFTKNKKQIKNLQRPTLPDGTKLITFPVLNTEGENSSTARTKKEWIMNPNGKSYVCILHEYVQHALKKQPSYEFKELENAATPYSATVAINGLKYGTGYGTSKKQAKSEAARETLEILIPQMKDKITGEKDSKDSSRSSYHDLSVFDEIKIEDPRVAEFCAKTTEPSPHAILLTCLQRNFGLGDVHIQYEINNVNHKKNEFKMSVGKHSTTVVCKNKRDGKQRASQAILQILHPHIKTWGSLLRLYGNRSIKSFKEKKQEEQEITVLQSKAAINQPNYAILDKLQLEMTKLMERDAAVKPIGTFIPPTDISLPTATGSNLKNVDL
ncbi:DGCR8 [Sergentomyia squamirostris]